MFIGKHFDIIQWTIVHYCHFTLMFELYDIWTGEAIQNGFLLLLTWPNFLRTFLLSGMSRLILYLSCFSTGISHFPTESSSYWGIVLSNQDFWPKCTTLCYWSIHFWAILVERTRKKHFIIHLQAHQLQIYESYSKIIILNLNYLWHLYIMIKTFIYYDIISISKI